MEKQSETDRLQRLDGTPGTIHSVFYNASELRAAWQLCIFLTLVFVLIKSGNLLVRRLLHSADHSTVYLAARVMDLLILVFVSWIMGRIEGRSVGDYGLPWRSGFRARFWQGALLEGCAKNAKRSAGTPFSS